MGVKKVSQVDYTEILSDDDTVVVVKDGMLKQIKKPYFGSEQQLQVSGDWIQWRASSNDNWKNLVSITTLTNDAVPKFSIGTIETIEVGQQPSATITGTNKNPVLNLKLPKGDTSEQQMYGYMADVVNAGYHTAESIEYSGQASDYGIDIMKIYGKSEQKQYSGKNLLSARFPPTTLLCGITLTNNGDGTYTAKGTATDNFNIVSSLFSLDDGDYKLFDYCDGVFPNDTSARTQIYSSTTQSILTTVNNDSSDKIRTGHINSGDDYQLRFRFSKDTTYNVTYKPMLYQDGDGTYEPYVGGMPSPNPDYPQEIKSVVDPSVKVCGKNLFDNDSYEVISNGNYSKDFNSGYLFDFIKNKIVKDKPCTFSWEYYSTGTINACNQIRLFGSSTIIIQNGGCVTLSEDFINSIHTISCYFGNTDGSTTLSGYMKKFQIELGSTATEYEPYKEQITTTLPYTLNAIPVDSGGNVTIDGQEYIADYVDVERKKLVRCVGEVDLGSLSYEYNNDYKVFMAYHEDIKTQRLLCTNFMRRGGCGSLNTDTSKYFICSNFDGSSGLIPKYNVVIRDTNYTDTELFKQSLQGVLLYYRLATPTEIDLTEKDIQSLKLPSYYPYTNVFFDSDVKPSYVKWRIHTKTNDMYTKQETLDKTIGIHYALQRTGKVYTVKFPLFSTSNSPAGTKLDDNAGLSATPSTDTVKGLDDYENLPLFKTIDVNAYVDENGNQHVTAIKGDDNFKDTGEVDVFVMGMTRYEKYWIEDGYWYYSITDYPKEGYTPLAESINNDGTVRPFCLYSKYVSGKINDKPYSSKGLAPWRYYPSYNTCVDCYHKRGKYYSAGMLCDYKYVMTTFYLKYATLNSQSVINGCFNYSYQYAVAVTESDVRRVILTTAQANNLLVGSYISIGDKGSNSSLDRANSYMHNIADSVEIIKIEAIDDTNSAVYVNVENTFTTTETTYISTMHWRSGFSDKILGRDGSPYSCTSDKTPMVVSGIELAVGGYEVPGNAFMDIVDATGKREVYICNDASKLTTNVTTAKEIYKKSKYATQPTNLSAWNYVTRMDIDTENGAMLITEAGASGSGSATGYCDGLYVDSGSSGQREFLLLGPLGGGSLSGLSFLYARNGLSDAHWSILARLSINGVGGELASEA